MKILALLFALWCFNYTTANAQLTNGLVAHWNFNGNANDATNNGHNGTATNITYTAGKTGLSNTAASFNGQSSRINIPYQQVMNLEKFSICALVKVNGYYQGACQANHILSRSPDHTNGHYSLHFSDNPFDNVNCQSLDTSKHVFYSGVKNKSLSVANSAWQYTPTIVSGQWYCVISTYDSFKNDVYVNGTLVASVQLPVGSVGTSTDGINIGISSNNSQYPYWLNGEIDDLRLYNRALSASEVVNYCALFDTSVYITGQPTQKLLCSDDTFTIAYGIYGSFHSGNTFIAELSDATGSFASPQTLGLVITTTAGTITCNVPSNLPQGSNYKVRIRSTNPVRYSDISQSLSIQANLTPSVSITANPNGPYTPGQYITFKATPVDAGSAPTYQWYRNGNAITGAIMDSLYINTLNDGDSIYVIVFSSNQCPPDLSATSNKIAVNINTSVNDITLPNLSLYPNPNNGTFTVSADNIKYDELNISVINATGQVVYKYDHHNNSRMTHTINMKSAPAGIYLLRISAESTQRNIRFIIH